MFHHVDMGWDCSRRYWQSSSLQSIQQHKYKCNHLFGPIKSIILFHNAAFLTYTTFCIILARIKQQTFINIGSTCITSIPRPANTSEPIYNVLQRINIVILASDHHVLPYNTLNVVRAWICGTFICLCLTFLAIIASNTDACIIIYTILILNNRAESSWFHSPHKWHHFHRGKDRIHQCSHHNLHHCSQHHIGSCRNWRDPKKWI